MNRTMLAGLALLAALAPFPGEPLHAGDQPDTPRNVIFMIGDGMSLAQVKAYRMYADDPATTLVEPLPMERYLAGAVSTDSIRLECSGGDCVRDPHGFTDSASSATAYATGHDTVVGHLSITPDGKPLPTVLEAARRQGKSTGLVATSEITHATPAAFASHIVDRDRMDRIAEQYFDLQWEGRPQVDVLLGGGRKHLVRDDRDIAAEFRQAGYAVVENREQLLAAGQDRILGLFARRGMPRAWDRGPDIPSLAEMTRVALRSLSKNPAGFFLMVEGSQVDWAAHKNSVVGVVSEMEDFVGAIRVALEFTREHGDTLLIITGDHETGGMSLGRNDIYRWNAQPIHGVKHTPKKMMQEYRSGDERLSDIVKRYVPFALNAQEIAALDATPKTESAIYASLATVFDRRTLTAWGTTAHTGLDVPLYVTGPGSGRFGGVMQNEELGRVLWQVFLPAVTTP